MESSSSNNPLRVIGGFAKKHVAPLSALLFLTVMCLVLGFAGGLAITAVLVVHEYGHVAGSRYFGLKNAGVIFIPFLGGMTGVTETPGTNRRAAIIWLAGPSAGLLTGLLGIIAMQIPALKSFGSSLVMYSAVVNLFNLLPIVPLDGGMITQTVLSRASRRIRTAAILVGVGILGGIVLMTGWVNLVSILIMIYSGVTAYNAWKSDKLPLDGLPPLYRSDVMFFSGVYLVVSALHLYSLSHVV